MHFVWPGALRKLGKNSSADATEGRKKKNPLALFGKKTSPQRPYNHIRRQAIQIQAASYIRVVHSSKLRDQTWTFLCFTEKLFCLHHFPFFANLEHSQMFSVFSFGIYRVCVPFFGLWIQFLNYIYTFDIIFVHVKKKARATALQQWWMTLQAWYGQ